MTTTVVNLRAAPFDVYIGRGSDWGNPYRIGVHGDRAEVIRLYCQWLLTKPALLEKIHTLRGKVLGCYCKPQACHGDILAAVADGQTLIC